MRAVIQRVQHASVQINGGEIKCIGKGMVILLGVEEGDADEDVSWLADKITRLRIFDDVAGVMNLSVQDVNGQMMIISQFTLHASTKKGNRPGYTRAARPETAIPLYEKFIDKAAQLTGKAAVTGEFGADMLVTIANDGPVTIIIDTRNKE